MLSYTRQFFGFAFKSYIYRRIMGISTGSGVIITYVIRQTTPLHRWCRYEMIFQIHNYLQAKL